jgi:uncharacterized protein (DUF697 family)
MDTLRNAERAVTAAVAATAATGAIPVPFADAPLLIGEQVAMMAAIAKIFGLNIKEDGLKTLAAAAIGVGGATFVGKTVVSNLLKFIPGVGWLIGGAISGTVAGAVTYGIGKAFIEVCKVVQIGKMEERDITSKDGMTAFLGYFKDFFKLPERSSERPSHEEDRDWFDDDPLYADASGGGGAL